MRRRCRTDPGPGRGFPRRAFPTRPRPQEVALTTTPGASHRPWDSLTTDEVGDLAARDPVVVLPLGAVEQHGPHLPLSTDVDIGRGLLGRALQMLPDDFPVLSLPFQSVGASAEHTRFPGTLSLEPEQLVDVIVSLGEAVARSGVRRLVLFSSHGGNRAAVDVAALRLRDRFGLLAVKATWFRFGQPEDVSLPESEWRHGLHGGAVETAMMLHLHPDRVRVGAIPDARSRARDLGPTLEDLVPGGAAPFAWMAGDLNPGGAVGNAKLADAEMGRRLVDHYAGVLAQVVRGARSFPIDGFEARSGA